MKKLSLRPPPRDFVPIERDKLINIEGKSINKYLKKQQNYQIHQEEIKSPKPVKKRIIRNGVMGTHLNLN